MISPQYFSGSISIETIEFWPYANNGTNTYSINKSILYSLFYEDFLTASFEPNISDFPHHIFYSDFTAINQMFSFFAS